MKVSELLKHIDGIFKIYITEKDKKTEVGLYADKWDVPNEICEQSMSDWFLTENRVRIALDR